MKFVKLQTKRPNCQPLDYGYVLKISSPLELAIYHATRFGKIWEEAMCNLLKSREYQKMITLPAGVREGMAPHISNKIASAIHQYAIHHADDKKNIHQLGDNLYQELYNTQAKFIEEGAPLYVMQSGGYFPQYDDCIEGDCIESKDCMIFPENKLEQVRYTKWDGGMHWYAKIGTMDVVDEAGNQKWCTKEEAEQAVSDYLANM